MSLSELAAELAERADHRPDGSDADRIAVRLHHADLPLLADAGLLEYDVDERTVAARPAHGRPGRVY